MRAAEFVVTCTDANREHLRSDRARGARAPRLPRPERRLRPPARRAPPPAERTPIGLRIISVGRLVTKKGFDVLVDAVALLRDRGVDVELRDRRRGRRPTRPTIRRRVTAARARRPWSSSSGPLSQAELLAAVPAIRASSRSPAGSSTTATATASPTCWSRRWPPGSRSCRPRCPASPSSSRTTTTACWCRPRTRRRWRTRSGDWPRTRRSRDRLARPPGAGTVAEHFDGEALARQMSRLCSRGRR